ncbi:MAG: hypothetical protein Q7U77_15745 [Sediminibacterium sp.]|uniref:hypothetical protein n=1 Tax=Sediminibacterium sp. TaxID=1917865 RepID=UPI00271F708B|nr:hypothetical protein [Sediminibacterium sp.]MDO8998075.1 hypothetical protein [Sediminibacterium sp.]
MNFSIKKMNPIWVILSYSCIIICGDKMCILWCMSYLGGLFVIDYWFISIPAFTGIFILGWEVISPNKFSFTKRIVAIGLLYAGFIAYFLRSGASYNYPTLTLLVPQISIGLFIFLSILFVVATFQKKKHNKKNKRIQ